jgi:uncharacterized protein YcbK (DUF882 family)
MPASIALKPHPGDARELSATRNPGAWSRRPASRRCGEPAQCVAEAIATASAAVTDFEDPGASSEMLSPRSALEAWLRVDEAVNLARLAAAPRPDPRPVSIERRLSAERRRVAPGELHLFAINTRERIRIRLYDADGMMRPDAVRQASWLMRDQRANRARSIDPRLLTMLYRLGQHFDSEVQVVSAYRVRYLNATEGSRHGQARACDVRIAGRSNQEVAAFIESRFARVGVGVYPHSGFVHIDSRESTYLWTDTSRSRKRSRYRARGATYNVRPSADPTLLTPHITEEELYPRSTLAQP